MQNENSAEGPNTYYVQKTYYSMPEPLHLEVKHYIGDLRNNTEDLFHSIIHQLLRFERKMELFDCPVITGL